MAGNQWHPAFCAAMRLELENSPALQFTNEFNLTEKPLQVDLLIVKKPADMKIQNGIGEFFEVHNLLEYKSPTDHKWNEYAVYQALSYAYYYCERYQTKNVTITLVVSREHYRLMRWFACEKITYRKRHNGIYTIEGISLVKMQVVVTEELDEKEFRWLSAMTDHLTEARAKDLIETVGEQQYDRESKRLIDAIMAVVVGANETLFEKVKEDATMNEVLMRLMKPEIDQYTEKVTKEITEEVTKEVTKEVTIEVTREMTNCAIRNMLELGVPKEKILTKYTAAEYERACAGAQ